MSRGVCHDVEIIIAGLRNPADPQLTVVRFCPELHQLAGVEVRRFADGERRAVVSFTLPGEAHRQDLAFARMNHITVMRLAADETAHGGKALQSSERRSLSLRSGRNS